MQTLMHTRCIDAAYRHSMVCVCVCLMVTTMSCTNRAELIQTPFEIEL